MWGDGGALVLDSSIRNWVLVSIAAVVFITTILKHFIFRLTASKPRPATPVLLYQGHTLMRANKLHTRSCFLPLSAFRQRKAYFCSSNGGILAQPAVIAAENSAKNTNSTPSIPSLPGMPAMLDQNSMMDMMKNNVTMMVPQLLLMSWVSFFFSGFLVLKLPFPLTQRFKVMLQRGIELASLDVSYVSSHSWYFLTLFGLRGITSLVLGSEAPPPMAMGAPAPAPTTAPSSTSGSMPTTSPTAGAAPQPQSPSTRFPGNVALVPGVPPQPGGPAMARQDMAKSFTAEKENIELVAHSWDLSDIELRMISKLLPTKS
ncbi:ER membrane protein complex subunit 3 [Pelomyxa schiedti]|nr:ER membrane protein complex subunit 3 [Pelomyxa schiedti]